MVERRRHGGSRTRKRPGDGRSSRSSSRHARVRTGLDDWSTSPIHETPEAEAEYFARCRRVAADGVRRRLRGHHVARGVRRARRPAVAAGGVPGGGSALRRQQRVHRLDDRARGGGADDARVGRAAGSATCGRCSAPTRCGASCSASPTRARISRTSDTRGARTATSSSSTGRRSGHRVHSTPTSGCCSRAPIPTRRSIAASRSSCSTCGQPGVEVRPLRQMTGAAHFNEVFLHSVRVPAVAGRRRGRPRWAVARTVLAAESSMIGNSLRFDVVVELARHDARARVGVGPGTPAGARAR